MIEKKYVRCEHCSFVFEDILKTCPKCEKERNINEELNNDEPVFNICDSLD